MSGIPYKYRVSVFIPFLTNAHLNVRGCSYSMRASALPIVLLIGDSSSTEYIATSTKKTTNKERPSCHILTPREYGYSMTCCIIPIGDSTNRNAIIGEICRSISPPATMPSVILQIINKGITLRMKSTIAADILFPHIIIPFLIKNLPAAPPAKQRCG